MKPNVAIIEINNRKKTDLYFLSSSSCLWASCNSWKDIKSGMILIILNVEPISESNENPKLALKYSLTVLFFIQPPSSLSL